MLSSQDFAAGSPGSFFRNMVARLVDVAFPRNCVVTGRPAENPPWRFISPEGLARLDRVREPYCETCGFPFFGHVVIAQQCPHCFALKPVFRHGRTAVIAKGAGRQIIHELKYRRGTHLLEDIARIMLTTPGLPEFLAGAVLVPVPLHASRLRKRGFNQAELIAGALAGQLRGTRCVPLLRRVKNTSTQTRLDREARALNVRGAFVVNEKFSLNAGTRYVVFDDVFTTGATLNACCRALHKAGAEDIDVLSFAHG